MDSKFGEVFMFLTKLAWNTRLVIPALITTAFLIMDIRLQVEINIQTGQVAAADLMQENDDDDDIEGQNYEDDSGTEDEYTTDSSDYDDDEHGNISIEVRNGSNGQREDDDDYGAGNFLGFIH